MKASFPLRDHVSPELRAALDADRERERLTEEAAERRFGRCARCMESVLLSPRGFVTDHAPAFRRAPGRTDRCPGSGRRPHAWRTAPTEFWRSLPRAVQDELGRAELGLSDRQERFAVLRKCPPMILRNDASRVRSHAVLDIDDAAQIIHDAALELPSWARTWLEGQPLSRVYWWGLACLCSALRVPIAYEGGLNDREGRDAPGNGWGRYADALPFARRGRIDEYPSRYTVGGDNAGAYCGRYARGLHRDARKLETATRAIKMREVPLVSRRVGKQGPFPSTGKTYPRRYGRSFTYLTCGTLSEIYQHPELIAWRDAIRQVCRPRKWGGRHAWAWCATEQARRARVGISYEEQVLVQKFDRREAYRDRAIRRKYARSSLGKVSSHQVKARCGKSQKDSRSTREHPPGAARGPPGPPNGGRPATVIDRKSPDRGSDLAKGMPSAGFAVRFAGRDYASPAELLRAIARRFQ